MTRPGIALIASVVAMASWLAACARGEGPFIESGFENASPVWYEPGSNGATLVHLLYDHERGASNRASGHIHLAVHAHTGTPVVLEFVNLENIYNGRPSAVSRELRMLSVSSDGSQWIPMATEILSNGHVRLALNMSAPRLLVARIEPYRLSDLDRLLAEVRASPLTAVTEIGRTVAGRPLEIVRIGDEAAPHRVFLRARAHPWESGGNWVVQGLIRRLLGDGAAAMRSRYCTYILPMANKDGVARGLTRFNLKGMDLNRKWDQPADPQLAPENAALERWLEEMIRAGRRPDLAIDLHNDGWGMLHISRPNSPRLASYLANMERLESLLRRHTWFTEGHTAATFRNPGSLGDGWLERFGIDAAVHELNCNRIAGLNEPAAGRRWEEYGGQLAVVFNDYFGAEQ